MADFNVDFNLLLLQQLERKLKKYKVFEKLEMIEQIQKHNVLEKMDKLESQIVQKQEIIYRVCLNTLSRQGLIKNFLLC